MIDLGATTPCRLKPAPLELSTTVRIIFRALGSSTQMHAKMHGQAGSGDDAAAQTCLWVTASAVTFLDRDSCG
jgi:hypothetical protein